MHIINIYYKASILIKEINFYDKKFFVLFILLFVNSFYELSYADQLGDIDRLLIKIMNDKQKADSIRQPRDTPKIDQKREADLRRQREADLRRQREERNIYYYRGRQEFGPYFARFTIDVKDWTPTATQNGASFLSADKTCNVVIAVDKNHGYSAEALAKAIVQQAGVSNAQEVSKDAKSCTMKGTIQGKDILISVSVEGDNFYCISINGDIQKGASFIETLDEKK